jgi:general secretion pathway protein G
MPIPREQRTVFFAWERRRGVRSVFGRARARQAMLVFGVLATFAFLNRLEQHASRVRVTRASITTAMNAVAAWRADHDRGCPPSLAEVVSAGYLNALPRDAWGRQLRVTCPGRRDPRGFDVSSDGPDGRPEGLDRVE